MSPKQADVYVRHATVERALKAARSLSAKYGRGFYVTRDAAGGDFAPFAVVGYDFGIA